MTVVVSLLKILGFLVLLVLGVLLLHILLLLLVPFRYRLSCACADRKAEGSASLRWLAGYLSATADVSEAGVLSVCCRILGFQVWNYTKQLPWPGKQTEPEQKQAEPEQKQTETGHTETDTGQKPSGSTEAEKTGTTAAVPEETHQPQTAPHTFLQKLGTLGNRLKLRLETTLSQLRKAQNKLDALLELLCDYRDFFLSEQHRDTFLWIWERVRKVLAECKPTEGSGQLMFGTGDPYSTGQLLELLAFLYPFYGDWMEVVPRFDSRIFSLRLDVRGRIRLMVPAFAALQLYCSKEVKALIKEFREVAEHG